MASITNLIELQSDIKNSQRVFLNLLEAALYDHPKWTLIRAAVMDTFGGNGIEGRIRRLINTENRDCPKYPSDEL